jgi:hypothetical protein
MSDDRARFEADGFFVVPKIITTTEKDELAQRCDGLEIEGAGSRELLKESWVQILSQKISTHPLIQAVLPVGGVPVQCTYFHKSTSKNWLVPLHRDTSIPLHKKFEAQGWSRWSLKEGTWFAKPPTDVLASLVAVRVHLENNTIENGALQLIPGSHQCAESTESRITCEVPAGGALVMRPLILHSSSKLSAGSRRVLHFLYGPSSLPRPAEWAYAM